jgi:PKD repeat protein
MKKILLQIMFMMLMLPMMAQTVVHIYGTVTDTANGTPVPGHAVYILSDSSYGYVYYNTVYTGPTGFYSDTIPVPTGSSGVFYVYTFDCMNLIQQVILPFDPSNLYLTHDFSICNSNVPCQANFNYDALWDREFHFYDASTGNPTAWNWDFGDGGTSSEENPWHTYNANGYYSVTLTISTSMGCSSTYYETVYANDSTGGGCNAAFYVVPDSLNNPPNTFYFVDQSTGNIGAWLWNFGDGTYMTITYPGNPNVVHTYAGTALTHIACLTIQGVDSTCYDQTCDTINSGSGIGCLANFTYSFPANTSIPTLFSDLSQTNGGGTITSWSWNFGDPGSGSNNVSNIQNPAHLFSAAGSYNVCLTIQGADSLCFDIFCQTIIVGTNTGCQAYFTDYPDSLNTALIQFTDQSSGNINSWSWNFGDPASGPFNFSNLQNPEHQFTVPGTFYVCLTIQGADSTCYDVFCKTVIVGNSSGCMAMFTYNGNPAGGNAIQFTDQSTGNPNNWMWNFGDSTYSTEQNPFHIYPAPGVYIACLTITANNGTNCTSTFCLNVFVNDSVVSNQIYGQVFEGNLTLQLGMALIFSLDSNLNYAPYVDICSIDSMGFYYFNDVPDGNYLVFAIPFDSNGYLPTYYGDVLNWAEATVIEVGVPNNPYDIHLLQAGYMPAGPGSVGGQVNMGNLKSSMLDKMMMLLMDEEGHAISFDQVSESGSFNFPSMAYGTYYLYAEMAGITSDYIIVVLTPEKPHADVVMTFSGKTILGIGNKYPELEAGVIYPNPATDKVNLTLNLKEGAQLKVEIFNQGGQITSSMMKSLDPGKNVLTLSVSELAPGFYTLRLTSENGINISRKLLIAK